MARKLTPAQHQREYGYGHRSLRKRLAPLVEAGLFSCPKCGKQIKPGEPFDLGHQENGGRAPEHCRCNRATVYQRARGGNGEFLPGPRFRAGGFVSADGIHWVAGVVS
jgi:hypothetical protein